MFAAMQYSNKYNYHSQVNKQESYSGNDGKPELKSKQASQNMFRAFKNHQSNYNQGITWNQVFTFTSNHDEKVNQESETQVS